MKTIIRTYTAVVAVLIFIIISSFTASEPQKKQSWLSIEKAIKSGIIEAKIASRGGHSGNCLVANLKSHCAKDTFIYFEAGRRIDSDDSSLQDILLVRDQMIAISPGQEKKVNLFGYCCQVHNHSPAAGSRYSAGKMADSPLVTLACFLNLHREIPANSVQHAIWSISDNIPVASVHESDPYKISDLTKLLAKLKGIEIPWYSLTYATDSLHLFSGVAKELFGEIPYYIPNNSEVSMVVYDVSGKVVKVIFEDVPHNPDQYYYAFSMEVSGLPAGKYFVRIFAGGQKKAEKIFVL